MKIVKNINKKFEPVCLKLESQEEVDKIYAVFNVACIVNCLLGDKLSYEIRTELQSSVSNERSVYTKLLNTAINECSG